MAFAEQEFGGIDILCNYAGFHGGGDITTVLREQWRIAMDVTCLGIYRAVRAAYPYMKKHHYGRIMNFASIGGRANRGVPVTYAGFKAAAIGLTRALALELAADGITVNSIDVYKRQAPSFASVLLRVYSLLSTHIKTFLHLGQCHAGCSARVDGVVMVLSLIHI